MGRNENDMSKEEAMEPTEITKKIRFIVDEEGKDDPLINIAPEIVLQACKIIDTLTADLAYASKVSYQQFKSLSAEIEKNEALIAENKTYLFHKTERENIFQLLNEKQLPICGGVCQDRIVRELIQKFGQLQDENAKLKELETKAIDGCIRYRDAQ